jgi:hypothetical protein
MWLGTMLGKCGDFHGIFMGKSMKSIEIPMAGDSW